MEAETRLPAAGSFRVGYLQWGPIVAGAIAAAALSFVLHAFASAIGLAASSTAPTWRDSSIILWVLSGVYLVVVAVAAYGLGGYVAGRMRAGLLADASSDEVEFRDGVHGLLVWALATLLTALLAVAAAQGLARLAAPATGPVGTSTSAGEGLFPYELDRLFRSDRPVADIAYSREEASRILLTAGSHEGVTADDRGYLARLVAARTGVSESVAQERTQNAITLAADSIRRARHSTVVLAFFAGAAAMVGAAAAWFAACVGGEHRDRAKLPSLRWAQRNRQALKVSR
jgi:hypothetical protein